MIYTRIGDKNVAPERARVILSACVDNNNTTSAGARSGKFLPHGLIGERGGGSGGKATKHEMNDGRFHALAGLFCPSIN
jgi:hypothetical protein